MGRRIHRIDDKVVGKATYDVQGDNAEAMRVKAVSWAAEFFGVDEHSDRLRASTVNASVQIYDYNLQKPVSYRGVVTVDLLEDLPEDEDDDESSKTPLDAGASDDEDLSAEPLSSLPAPPNHIQTSGSGRKARKARKSSHKSGKADRGTVVRGRFAPSFTDSESRNDVSDDSIEDFEFEEDDSAEE